MSDRLSLVVTDQYQKISNRWDSLLKVGESVCIIFPYLSDRQFRFKQYTDSLTEKDFISINLNPIIHLVDDFEDLKNLINNQLPAEIKQENLEKSLLKNNSTIVLAIPDGESLIKPGGESILEILQNICVSFRNIKILIAFESDIYKIIPSFHKYNLLFQNIIYYPLYKDEDMMIFVNYLCQNWQIKMPQPIRKSIVYNSGGFFLLTKEACRIFRDTGTWSKESPNYQLRLNHIFNSLSDEEKNIIISCPQIKSFENSKELNHLKKISLIKEDNTVSVPELTKIITKNKVNKKIFKVEDQDITLNGISLYQVLSATEYLLLKHFLSKSNIPITRDEISKIMWPTNTEEYYSEWAIDQAIKRLRDRLVSLKLSPTVIKSVRGVGYEFRT